MGLEGCGWWMMDGGWWVVDRWWGRGGNGAAGEGAAGADSGTLTGTTMEDSGVERVERAGDTGTDTGPGVEVA